MHCSLQGWPLLLKMANEKTTTLGVIECHRLVDFVECVSAKMSRWQEASGEREGAPIMPFLCPRIPRDSTDETKLVLGNCVSRGAQVLGFSWGAYLAGCSCPENFGSNTCAAKHDEKAHVYSVGAPPAFAHRRGKNTTRFSIGPAGGHRNPAP